MDLIDTGQTVDFEHESEMEKRYSCCCQCHIKRRLPPANETHVRRPFLNPKTGSDDRDHNPIRSKFKTKLRTSYREGNFSDSFRTRTEYRNRKKNSCWILSEENCLTNLVCQKWKSFFRKKQRMMRIMCHCVIFVIIISLCGVLMYSDSHKDKDITIDYYPDSGLGEDFYSSGSSHIILDQPFKSVPVDEFEKHLDKAKNVADLLRIFFEQKDLSDFDINTIMNMKSKHIYGTSHFERRNKPRSWMNDDEDAIEDRAAAFEHHLEMARSPLGTCRFPLPEIEYVHSVESDTFRHYYPRCTVVHRCRNYTGCCPNGEVCGPKKENGIRIFTKAFLVFEVVPGTNYLRPSRRNFVEKRMFIDHIECQCSRVDYTSNCHKKCPQQFTKRRHGIDCECACTHQARLCKFIHRGHLPLEEKDLECIKAGECIKPKCATGEFRIHTGFCPTKKHHRRKG